MNLYCIKCLMFTENNTIKIKRQIDSDIDCGFKGFETVEKNALVIY